MNNIMHYLFINQSCPKFCPKSKFGTEDIFYALFTFDQLPQSHEKLSLWRDLNMKPINI